MVRPADRTPDAKSADAPQAGRFERIVLPHLSAGFTLAMYLTRNTADAEDAVQEAVLRAVRYFPTLRDDDARAWFLTIVRRVCYTAYGLGHPSGADVIPIDSVGPQLVDDRDQPDAATARLQVQQRVRDAIDQLPPLLREAIVLRELQACSYAEIAAVTEVPVGTVMSRLARARTRLAAMLQDVVDFGDVA
jgi:RNA polymerase sigma factor (sigma-70 family)